MGAAAAGRGADGEPPPATDGGLIQPHDEAMVEEAQQAPAVRVLGQEGDEQLERGAA